MNIIRKLNQMLADYQQMLIDHRAMSLLRQYPGNVTIYTDNNGEGERGYDVEIYAMTPTQDPAQIIAQDIQAAIEYSGLMKEWTT